MKKLNPETGEMEEVLNPEEDENIEDDLDFLNEEQDADKEKALEIFNKAVGKNYKSWEDVAKSERQRDIEFAQKPKKEIQKEVPATEVKTDNTMSERLLKVEHPESKFVIDMIKADHPEKDPYKVWESSEYYRKEAQVRAEKELAKQRIENPAGNGEVQAEVDEIEQKFINNLPPKFAVKK